jgi:hypothetical protein
LGIFIFSTLAAKDLFANKLQRLSRIRLMLFTLESLKVDRLTKIDIFSIPTQKIVSAFELIKEKKLIVLSSTKVCC